MPIYEYECLECGAQVAQLMQPEEPPPTCEGGIFETHAPTPMTKVPSTPSFIVKGINAANGYSRTTTR